MYSRWILLLGSLGLAGCAASAQSPAPAAPVVRSGTIKHTVRSGDSLWSIARHYNVRVSDLMRWNDLSKNTVIKPGQAIKINL